LALPAFNNLANTQVNIPFTSPLFIIAILSGIILIGTIAGVYPAFFLSAFSPAAVLKGKLNLGVKSGLLRSTLVIFQFVISTILIVATLVINKQLSYMMTKNLGFNKEQVLLVEDAYGLGDQIQNFKSKVKQLAGVTNATVSGYLPIGSNRSDNMYWREGQTPNEETMVSTQTWRVDYDYIETLGMQLLTGRNFDPANSADSTAIIVNEEALRLFGVEEPLGAHIVTWAALPDEDGNAPMEVYTIIGVVKDFHFSSLKDRIDPLFLEIGKSSYYLSVRVEDTDLPSLINNIEAEWVKLANGIPFAYSFMDERYNERYQSEARVSKLFTVFAIFAIVIACLGLFGLAAFTAQQRTKEIGVRKVMGASVPGIVILLSKEFGKLILIAMLIAFPVAWYGSSQWLEDYQFRINLSPWIFVVAGFITFLIAWLTMSYQSIKAATMSPAKSLRDE
jgi:putative ABC transport system permease protein